MAEATPRINASYLESFQGQSVRFVGKVVRLAGEKATVDCGGQITLITNRVCTSLIQSQFVITFCRIE
jgi:replication factor A3